MNFSVYSVSLTVVWTAMYLNGSPLMVFPDDSARFLSETPQTTNEWWGVDDSMRDVNERIGGSHMIRLMGWGLLSEPFQMLGSPSDRNKKTTPKILEALYRGGDDPRITNILHQALLAPTNHYREATFRAYVMASPVPMTRLAETVVSDIPRAERRQWYAHADETAWRPPSWGGLFGSGQKPSREALRFAHFLFIAKQIETDPECLRAIGNPTDPKRE
jgi:hypothetical protein